MNKNFTVAIVDDEPIIVDGLHELVEEMYPQLDVHKMTKISQVLEFAEMRPIHILVSDIEMPGMSGLELQLTVQKMHPECRVIFLSGFNTFDYAQNAIRQGAFDYILKTEDDDKILAVLNSAISDLMEDEKYSKSIVKAREQVHQALPLLQDDLLRRLLRGERNNRGQLSSLIPEYDSERTVSLLLIRIDFWPPRYKPLDKPLLFFAVHNIFAEIVPDIQSFQIISDISECVLFLQTRAGIEETNPYAPVFEKLEYFQLICKQLLDLSLSFILNRHDAEFLSVGATYERLKKMLQRGFGLTEEMIMNDQDDLNDRFNEQEAFEVKRELKQLVLLEKCLNELRIEEAKAICRTSMEAVQCITKHHAFFVETFASISASFTACINTWGLYDAIAAYMDTERLTQFNIHRSWEEAIQYFCELADNIHLLRKNDRAERTDELILRLKAFIESHLSEDLSVNRLAEIVHLHPNYLSRLFKQLTKGTLTDYVSSTRIARAKELLSQTDMKIHEVAKMVGIESTPYFIRLFRKNSNITPQEYRGLRGR